MRVAIGQVVYSRAGRDKGKRFIICEITDETCVSVSDGDLRKIEKPKKKKLKHLELTGEIVESLSEKIKNGLKVTNSEIRKTLAILDRKQENV